MQQRNRGKMRHYVVVVCALVSALAMFGCGGGGDGGDDGTTTTSTLANNTPIPVPVTTSNVQAVVGQIFTIPDGSAFSPGLPNIPLTLTFNSPSTVTLTSGTSTATGTVAFGSCTFTISASTIAGLPGGTTLPTFTTCQFVVTAIVTLEAGGAPGQATVILQLARPGGTPINFTLPASVTITVSLDANGQVIINGASTGVIIPPTTGTTGTGGTP